MNFNLIEIMKVTFGATLGMVFAYSLIALFSFSFIVPGYLILQKYNKEDTKLLKELQPKQYIGFVLIFIGCIPFLRYLIIGAMFNLGGSLMDNMV